MRNVKGFYDKRANEGKQSVSPRELQVRALVHFSARTRFLPANGRPKTWTPSRWDYAVLLPVKPLLLDDHLEGC
jgi:hypothetical protein